MNCTNRLPKKCSDSYLFYFVLFWFILVYFILFYFILFYFVKRAEIEWKGKEDEMLARHKLELASLSSSSSSSSGQQQPSDATAPIINTIVEDPTTTSSTTSSSGTEEKLSKQEKARRKKLAKKQAALLKEKEREERIAKENLEAGPSAKELELQRLQYPSSFCIFEIPADGHCLYRAVAHQLSSTSTTTTTFNKIREIAATELQQNRSQYEPFYLPDDQSTFDHHIEQVRSTAEWGGNMELRALANALQRPIIIYSTNPPLTIQSTPESSMDNPIRLTYHQSYYALGQHYNSLSPK